MILLLLALLAGYGAHLIFSAVMYGWRGILPGAPSAKDQSKGSLQDIVGHAGLGDLDWRTVAAAMAVFGAAGFAFGVLLFAGPLAGLIMGLFAATAPVGAARLRHQRVIEQAHRSWPGIIEEIRLLSGSLGRSIPQATFEVGLRAPEGLKEAFHEAHREWMMTTDFSRSMDVLKAHLSHNTADVVAETLVTAHELGGGEVGRRLEALAEDRLTDQQHRRDATARQSGVRFARWFVLVVPFGMALAGLSIGNGRAAYAEPVGQVLVATALVMVVACWVWAGRIMRLPVEDRVFG